MKSLSYYQREELIKQIALDLMKYEGWSIDNEEHIFDRDNPRSIRWVKMAELSLDKVEDYLDGIDN